MKKILILALGLLVSLETAQAQKTVYRKIKMATTMNREVEINKSKDIAKTFNLAMIETASPLEMSLEVVKGEYPSNKTLISMCKKSVKDILKSPASAQFSEIRPPQYLYYGGVYFIAGAVDSQNTYGALVRGDFYCAMAYSGDAKAGLLYIVSDVNTRR